MSARVLIVDDEAPLRTFFERALTRGGYTCAAAENATSALAEYVRHQPDAPYDVVITDLSMPGMDGRALVRQLRERTPGVPIIMLTGFAPTPADVSLDVVFMTKPVTVGALLSSLEHLLASSQDGH